MSIIFGVATDKYKLGGCMEGGCPNIYMVEMANEGTPFCCKRIRHDGMLRRRMNSEAHVMLLLNHQNIARYIDIFRYSDEAGCDIVMSYYKHGSLSRFSEICKACGRVVNEDLLWTTMAQLLAALEYCHSPINNPTGMPIIHSNINPKNIFLGDDGRIKLAGFDARCFYDERDEGQSLLMPRMSAYMAPEILETKNYTDKADVWSLGCVMYELATHKRLITGDHSTEQAECARNAASVALHMPNCSQEYCRIVSGMLTYDPAGRPAVTEILGSPEVFVKLEQWRASGMHGGRSSTSVAEAILASI